MNAKLLARALRDPASTCGLSGEQWNALIAMARGERLIGTLAMRLQNWAMPDRVAAILSDARLDAARERQQALWEADRAHAALAPLGIPVVLLKGTAYVAADLKAGEGRFIGDLDILVSREKIGAVEQALLGAGWEWVKSDPYDDLYYRRWMHELPPMIHSARDRMIDVHHTILPLTARQTPDAAAMIADAVALPGGLYVLSPEDRVCHAVAHLLADGDMSGGMRNLWDIRCLLEEISDRPALMARAARHGLAPFVARAIRLVDALYGGAQVKRRDKLYVRHLLARNQWGQEIGRPLRFAFFVRSHWLRMPPTMLARHLFTKWRKGHRPA